MTTLLIIFVVYGVSCTLFLIYQKYRKSGLPESAIHLREVTRNLKSDSDKVNALIQLAKVEQEQIPWWERSISTIGIVAFASMSVAATVQTINGTIAEYKLEQAQKQIEQVRLELKNSGKLLTILSQGALRRYRELGERDEVSTRLLSFRLKQIDGALHPNPDELKEAYAIAFAIGQYDTAFEILHNNPDILKETFPDDIVTLGEYYFMSSFTTQASQFAQSARDQFSSLSKSGKLRLLILDSALGNDAEKNVAAVQRLLRIPPDKARLTLSRAMTKLQTASKQISITDKP